MAARNRPPPRAKIPTGCRAPVFHPSAASHPVRRADRAFGWLRRVPCTGRRPPCPFFPSRRRPAGAWPGSFWASVHPFDLVPLPMPNPLWCAPKSVPARIQPRRQRSYGRPGWQVHTLRARISVSARQNRWKLTRNRKAGVTTYRIAG